MSCLEGRWPVSRRRHAWRWKSCESGTARREKYRVFLGFRKGRTGTTRSVGLRAHRIVAAVNGVLRPGMRVRLRTGVHSKRGSERTWPCCTTGLCGSTVTKAACVRCSVTGSGSIRRRRSVRVVGWRRRRERRFRWIGRIFRGCFRAWRWSIWSHCTGCSPGAGRKRLYGRWTGRCCRGFIAIRPALNAWAELRPRHGSITRRRRCRRAPGPGAR